MSTDDLGQVIARRLLNLDGKPTIEVLLAAPIADANGDCGIPVRITGLGEDWTQTAWGIDGFQALKHALLMIGVVLETSDEGRAGRITWDFGGDSGVLGFPSFPEDPSDPDVRWRGVPTEPRR